MLPWSVRPGIGKALINVYVGQANFTTKPSFENCKLRSFGLVNSQGSLVEKKTQV